MTDDRATVEVVIDTDGRVEIHGWKTVEEARNLAKRLGLPAAFVLARCEGLSAEDVDRVSGRARILGYAVRVVGEPEAETGAPGQEEEVETEAAPPPRRTAPWILVAPLVLVILILLAVPIRDRMYRSYRPMPSIGDVVARVESPSPPVSGMRELIDPDDSNYLSFAMGEKVLRVNNFLIEQGYCLRLHGQGAVPLPDLAGPGSGVLVVHVDAGRSSPDQLYVTAILRGGVKTAVRDVFMEVHPAVVADPPEGYAEGEGIVYDSKKTFQRLAHIRTGGRLERTPRGLRVDAGAFNAALVEDVSPGLRALLEAGWPHEEGATAAEPGVQFYLDRVELFPWEGDDGPGRRQRYGEIGLFRLAGVAFGGVYVRNGGAS